MGESTIGESMFGGLVLTTRSAATQVSPDLTTRQLDLKPASINEESMSVRATFTTEDPAQVLDRNTFRIVDEVLLMSGANVPDQIKMLDSHDRFNGAASVIGSGRDMKIKKREMEGTLVFAKDDEEVDRLWNKVRQRHITDVSIGYMIDESSAVTLEPGTTANVDGRKFKASEARPLRVVRSWTPREVSLTAIGADPNATIRHAGQPHRGNEMTAIRRWLQEHGLAAEANDEQQTEFLEGLEGADRATAELIQSGSVPSGQTVRIDPGPVAAAPGAGTASAVTTTVTANLQSDNAAIAEVAVKAERQRQFEIRKLAAPDVDADLIDRAIDRGWSVERANVEVLKHIREVSAPAVEQRGQAPGVIVHDRDKELGTRTLSAGLMIANGRDQTPRDMADESKRELNRIWDRAYKYRSMSLVDICRECVRLGGGQDPGWDPREVFRQAVMASASSAPVVDYNVLQHRGSHPLLTRAASVSTGALTVVFSTSINAQMLAGYSTAADTTAPWTKRVDVSNFLTQERGLLSQGEALGKVAVGIAADIGTRTDAKETYKPYRYGKQFVIDEQDVINDTRNALSDTPQDIGAAALRVVPDLVYSILYANAALGADSVALFASGHNNLNTTAGLGTTTLRTAIETLGTQQQDKVNLNLMPGFLLTSMQLSDLAFQLTRSQIVVATGSTDTEIGNLNTALRHQITSISDARLDNGVTDPDAQKVHSGAATTWYLVARDTRNTIEVGYVRGTGQAPVTRTFALTQGQWGIGWDIKHDVGAKALDYRAMVQNTA